MISVIALCYNGQEKLDRLLASLPLPKPGVETIIVDNGSTIPVTADGHRVIRVDPNRGIPGGFNAGMQEARGDWLVCLACDTLCQSPGFPENMIRPGKVMTGPSIRSQHTVGVPGIYLEGWCFAFPRTLVDDIGLMDEFYVYCFEDNDWSVRAQRAGYRLLQVNCGIVNPTPQSAGEIPKFYERNLGHLKEKFGWSH